MVVQEKFNQLKDASHDEKKVVAGSVAIFVVIVLIIAWGFFFLRKIQRTNLPSLENTTIPTDQFNLDQLRAAQNAYGNSYSPTDDIRNLRDSAAENQVGSGASGAAPSGVGQETGAF